MFGDLKRIIEVVEEGFRHPRVLVVGDLMLDRYYFGKVERISPEAPVPVVRVDHQAYAPGGAGNVACNLAALGCEVSLAGVVGLDEPKENLLDKLRAIGVDTSGVQVIPGRTTTVKTRVISGHQQMLRLDSEDERPLLPSDGERLLAALTAQIGHHAAVVLSDYAKGVLTHSVCRSLIDEARRHTIPVLIDPKGHDYSKYCGATMLSPNRTEVALATGASSQDIELLFQKAEALCTELGLEFVAVTLGELGIGVVDKGCIYRAPAVTREVFDVSGAGDTVIAIWAAGMAAGLNRYDCATLANVAAGIVIGRVGTGPVSRYELLAALSHQKSVESAGKICTLDGAQAQVARWRTQGERIIFTNGCFDVLHVGHISLLQRAKQMGGRLIVGLNSDESVRVLKGAARPIIGQDERAQILASLSVVDAVVLFQEQTPLNLIQALRPDVLVKGSDYREERVVGEREVRSWGGHLVLIPHVEGHSTTNLLSKFQSAIQVAAS